MPVPRNFPATSYNNMEDQLRQRASARLHAIPHLSYGHYPTPLEELPRLQTELTRLYGQCPRLLIKRDDYTGPGFGGNKVRKLEYVLAQAQADGAEVIITSGGVKSNHARATAALCARLGLRCILVLNEAAIMPAALRPASLTIDELCGAEVHRVATRAERAPTVTAIAAGLRSAERNVVTIPLGASIPLGAVGYVRAAEEAALQLAARDLRVDYIFHSTSSGGTQAGLLAGHQLYNLVRRQIIGVSADDPATSIAVEVSAIVRGIEAMLELPAAAFNERATVLDDYIGAGYGVPSLEGDAATQLLARTEGIVLDPVYTAKAMAALIDWIKQGRLHADETVLFWHTGGQLALFYAPEEKEGEQA
jgi:L-cysteate sulfo-lyase